MSNPYEGDSTDPLVPGIKGTNSKGDAVVGFTAATGKSGVLGISNGAFGAGVTGTGSISHGVHGVNGKGANNPPPVGAGLWGETEFGFGVYGASNANNGIHGDSTQGDAIVGIAHAQTKSGVLGISNGAFGAGVTGTSLISHGVHGVNGNGANNPPLVGAGLWGETDGGFGVYGTSIANNGIHGDSTNGDAVVGIAHAQGKAGILGISDKGNGVSGFSASGFAGFFGGNVRVTRNLTVDQDVVLGGGDCAEQFDVASSDEAEPGTVMVIGQDSGLRQSREAYDKSVAGVVSGAGDYKPGIVLDQREPAEDRKSIALVGKVYCKVDADYSPVQLGDLLTTSPTPGHAMKAADPLKAFGAVIGKALRPLRAGRGLIPILVALQ